MNSALIINPRELDAATIFDTIRDALAPEEEVGLADVRVDGYRRADGTMVKGHVRRPTRRSWHLTDKADFKLNPKYHPANNTTLGGDWPEAGIFVAPELEPWFNGYDYVRPFAVEIEHPVEKDLGGYSNEGFVPASDFAESKIVRVIPIDEYAREVFEDHGWIESHVDAISYDHANPRPFKGYRYEGPDVREMTKEQVAEHKRRVRKYIKETRPQMLAEDGTMLAQVRVGGYMRNGKPVKGYVRKGKDAIAEVVDTNYRGVHTAPDDSYGASLDQIDGVVVDKNFYDNLHFYYDGGPRNPTKYDLESAAAIRSARGKPDMEITIYRAVPAGVDAIHGHDWVTLSKAYAQQHIDSNGEEDWKIISRKVPVRELWWDANSLSEFGWVPGAKAGLNMSWDIELAQTRDAEAQVKGYLRKGRLVRTHRRKVRRALAPAVEIENRKGEVTDKGTADFKTLLANIPERIDDPMVTESLVRNAERMWSLVGKRKKMDEAALENLRRQKLKAMIAYRTAQRLMRDYPDETKALWEKWRKAQADKPFLPNGKRQPPVAFFSPPGVGQGGMVGEELDTLHGITRLSLDSETWSADEGFKAFAAPELERRARMHWGQVREQWAGAVERFDIDGHKKELARVDAAIESLDKVEGDPFTFWQKQFEATASEQNGLNYERFSAHRSVPDTNVTYDLARAYQEQQIKEDPALWAEFMSGAAVMSWMVSSQKTPLARMLQEAADREFEIEDEYQIDTRGGVAKLPEGEDHEDGLSLARLILRAQYEDTQEMFEEAGIDTLVVQRGMGNVLEGDGYAETLGSSPKSVAKLKLHDDRFPDGFGAIDPALELEEFKVSNKDAEVAYAPSTGQVWIAGKLAPERTAKAWAAMYDTLAKESRASRERSPQFYKDYKGEVSFPMEELRPASVRGGYGDSLEGVASDSDLPIYLSQDVVVVQAQGRGKKDAMFVMPVGTIGYHPMVIRDAAYKQGETEMQLAPLSSWTTDRMTAMGFQNSVTALPGQRISQNTVVLTARVPVEQVASTTLTGLGALFEEEVVLLGGRHPVHMNMRAAEGIVSKVPFEKMVQVEV